MARTTAGTIEEIRRNPDTVRRQLRSFERSADFFSREWERLLDRFEDQWVAVFDGEVVANADSLGDAIEILKKKGVPPGEAFIQRVDREQQTLILARDD